MHSIFSRKINIKKIMGYEGSWLNNYYPAYQFTQSTNSTNYIKLEPLVLPSLYATNKVQNIVGTAGTDKIGGGKKYEISNKTIKEAFRELEKNMENDFKGLGDEYHLSLIRGGKIYNRIYKKKNIQNIMTGTKFQNELSKLESLLGKLNKANKIKNVSNNMQGGKNPDVDARHFKVVAVDGKKVEDGGRYSLPTKTKSGKEQRRGPRDQASKAFSELCTGVKGECKHKITLQETTQGSHKKLFHYEIKRVKLAKPVVLKLKDKKTGKVKEVVKKFTNEITSLGSEQQKGGKYI